MNNKTLYGGAVVITFIAAVAFAWKFSYGPIASHKYTSNVKDIAYSKVCIDGHQYLHITDEGYVGPLPGTPIPRATTYVLNVNDDGTPVKCGI